MGLIQGMARTGPPPELRTAAEKIGQALASVDNNGRLTLLVNIVAMFLMDRRLPVAEFAAALETTMAANMKDAS